MKLDILIKHGTIVTANCKQDIINDGALAIEAGKIVAVGKTDEITKIEKADKVIDAKGKTVIPGLIDTHNHLFQTLLKGIGDDRKLINWIVDAIQPIIPVMNANDVYVAALNGCVEMIKSGTTSCVDFMAFPNPEFRHPQERLHRDRRFWGLCV